MNFFYFIIGDTYTSISPAIIISIMLSIISRALSFIISFLFLIIAMLIIPPAIPARKYALISGIPCTKYLMKLSGITLK